MPNVYAQFDTETNPYAQFDEEPGRTLTATELESGPSDPLAQAEIRRQMAGGEKPYDIYGSPKTSPESQLAQMKGALTLPTDVLGAAGGAIEKVIEPPLQWAYNKLPTVVKYPEPAREEPLDPTLRAIEQEELKGTDIPPLRGGPTDQSVSLVTPASQGITPTTPAVPMPPESEKGILPAAQRFISPMTTGVGAAQLPFFELKPVRALYAAQSLAAIPETLAGIAQAKSPDELKEAITRAGLNYTVARGLTSSVLPKEGGRYAPEERQVGEGVQAKRPGDGTRGAPAEAGVGGGVPAEAGLGKETPVPLSKEEQAYLDAEREGLGAEIAVGSEHLQGGQPFASNEAASINRETGKIVINPEEFRRALSNIPAERRPAYVRSLLGQEENHLATPPEEAEEYGKAMTGVERALETRVYTGKWTKAGVQESHGIELSNRDLGYEAIRRRMDQLAGLDPTELLATVGRERWTLKGINILQRVVSRIMETLPTDRANVRRGILEKVQGNLDMARFVAAGGNPASLNRPQTTPDPQQDQYATDKFVSKGVSKPALGPKYFHDAGESVNDPAFWVDVMKRFNRGDIYAQESAYQAGLFLRELGYDKAKPAIDALNQARAQITKMGTDVRAEMDVEKDPAKKMKLMMSPEFGLGMTVQFPREIIESAFNEGSAEGVIPDRAAPPLEYPVESKALDRQSGRELTATEGLVQRLEGPSSLNRPEDRTDIDTPEKFKAAIMKEAANDERAKRILPELNRYLDKLIKRQPISANDKMAAEIARTISAQKLGIPLTDPGELNPSSLNRPKPPKEHPELILGPAKGEVERGGFRPPQPGEVDKITDQFWGNVKSSGKLPSFEEFSNTLRAQFGSQVPRDSIWYSWQDSLNKHLMKATGEEITGMMNDLGLKPDVAEALQPGERDPYVGKIPDVVSEEQMVEQIKYVQMILSKKKMLTKEEFARKYGPAIFNKFNVQFRRRYAAIGAIMDKLTQKAGEAPDKSWDRTEIGPEDIAQGYAVENPLPKSEAEKIQAGESPEAAMPTIESRRMITRIPAEDAGDATKVGALATANAAVDATGKKAPPRTVSKNVMALLDRDGKVTLVSTWKDPRTGPKITNPTAPSLPGEKITANLLKSWSPLVVMTLRDPVQKFHKVFDSVNDFEQWFGDVGIEGTPGIQTTSTMSMPKGKGRGPFTSKSEELSALKEGRERVFGAPYESKVFEETPMPAPVEKPTTEFTRNISTLRGRGPTEVAGAPRGTGAEPPPPAAPHEPEMLSPEAQQALSEKGPANPYMGEAALRTLAHREVPKKRYTLESHLRYGASALREREPSSLNRPPQNTGEALTDWFKDIPFKGRVVLSQLAGRSAPKTSTASIESGNALVRYASSTVAAPQIAKALASEVLGNHYKDKAFGQKLGAVLVEDRLRAIREGALQAGDAAAAGRVQTVIGKQWSPLKGEADFRDALADPEIAAAVARHRAIIEPPAKMMHKEVGGAVKLVEDTGEFEEIPSPMTGPGLNTKSFINLKAIFPDNAEQLVGQAKRGNLENPLRKRARFSRQAKGSADVYELDYRTLAERMIKGNFEEYSKKVLYDTLVSHGLAETLAPGEPAPELSGKPTTKFTIERRGAYAGGEHARTYLKNLWVRSDIAPEVRQALNVDGPVGRAGIVSAARLMNMVQLAGPTDAVWHTANMLSSITSSQGGRTLLTDLARKIPGVNVADALARVTASAIKVLRDTPEVQQTIAHLAEIGAIRDVENVSRFQFNKKMIGLVDKAGRLVRNDLFNNLVDRGLVRDSEAARREWVNQMGQYNGRLMGQFQRFFKEAGFSPFVIAGRNFNRMAMRRITMDPGVKAASKTAALEMRAVEGLGTIATLFAIPALLNYFTTGNPSGRTGVKQGQIDTGKNDKDGNAIVIDPAQWTGLRRGMRISGIQAVLEGTRSGQSPRKITHQAISDILGGVIHPWAGPAVSALSTAATGYTPTFYKESKDPYDYGQNTLAALRQLNPLAAAALKSHEAHGGFSGALLKVGTALSAAGGVKTQALTSKMQQIQTKADRFVEDNHLKKQTGFDLVKNDEPGYTDLRAAISKNNKEEAKRVFDALRETHPLKKDRKGKVIDDPILDAMGLWTERPVTGSFENEAKFVQSLSDKDFTLYTDARDQRKELLKKYIDWYILNAGE